MFNVRQAGNVFDDVLFCAVLFVQMSGMRFGGSGFRLNDGTILNLT